MLKQGALTKTVNYPLAFLLHVTYFNACLLLIHYLNHFLYSCETFPQKVFETHRSDRVVPTECEAI